VATVLRPMNIGELLDRTFFLYRKHFIVFVSIVALPQLIMLAFGLMQLAIRSAGSGIAQALWTLVALLVNLVVLSIAYAATVLALSDVHLGKMASIRNAYAGTKGRLLKIVLVIVCASIGIFFGLILLIVPGIILGLAWSVSIPATVIEKEGPLNALQRSAQLTKGSRFRILVIMALITVFTYIVTLVFQAPYIFIAGSSILKKTYVIPAWAEALSLVGSFFSVSLLAPISTIAISLIYYDLRVRKEGFDLQFMMISLQTSPPKPTETQAIS
jgi:hypothetical protein